ncbi:MAG: hypothetical protein ACSHX6_01795 [Akkermansiaceae bacterium]
MKSAIKNLIILGTSTICLLVFTITTSSLDAQNKNHATETGPAKFLRDHDQAIKLSKKSGKPIFAFFQEVPG